ncbi:hypothetical protein SAMN05443248_8011 [Bradyrhizobium erythrophlei]|uniref:Uncharacterized protein n=1 Tax=Bradyrhizobium erythrophlei TaxID=1437360 RepID=A0A1M5Y7K0_9BRAD|nr:hypothetical protein SAMN05443248_8011 [Bradyrhizobium erythrophlei]
MRNASESSRGMTDIVCPIREAIGVELRARREGGYRKPDPTLDPWQGLVRIDPRPGELTACKLDQALSNDALGPVQTCQKHAACFADTIGNDRALRYFEIKRLSNEFRRNLEQLLGQRRQFVGRQATVPLVHGLGEGERDASPDPDHGRFLDPQLPCDRVGSHIEESDKLGKANFSELEEFKTLQSKQEVSILKRRLRELNIEIVKLEEQGKIQYRLQLEGQRKAKFEELVAIDAAKPKEVAKPDQEDPEQKSLAAEVAQKVALLKSLGERIQRCVEATTRVKSDLQQIVSLQERLITLKSDAERTIGESAPQLKALGVDPAAIVAFTVNLNPIETRAEAIRAQLAILEMDRKLEFSDDADFSVLESLPDLRRAHAYVGQSIEGLKEKLGTPQRQYQNYLERLTSWQKRRDEMAGAETEAKPDSLRGIEAQLQYLDEELAALLGEKRNARRAIVNEIFDAKRKVLRFYADLKRSVETRLAAVRADGFWIEIDASFVIDIDFRRKFLELINRRRRGVFRDAQDADAELTSSLSRY